MFAQVRGYKLCLFGLTVLLFKCSLAAHESSITVDFDNALFVNDELSISVPRVSQVVVKSARTLQFTSEGDSPQCELDAGNTKCTLDIQENPKTVFRLFLDTSFNATEDLTYRLVINVNEQYSVGCSNYVFPVQLDLGMATNFSCVPVFVDELPNVTSVQWLNLTDLDMLSSLNVLDYLVDLSLVELSNIGEVVNATVDILSSKRGDAGYYIPVITLSNGTVISDFTAVSPIIVTYEPVIRTSIQEFSFDFYIDPNIPRNFSYNCNAQAFPIANIVWRYRSTFDISLGNMTISTATPPNVIIDNSITRDYTTINGRLTIVDVGYENSGIYTCFAENVAYKTELKVPVANPNGISIRLRVKDHLRPLWPAVGVIGVAIVTPLLMLLGTLCDKGCAKIQSDTQESANQRLFSVSSSASGSPDGANNNIKLTGHGHSAVRRMSSAKVQLLEESTNV